MTINFQRLLDVCKATEELPLGGFDMATVYDTGHECGTAGCMIGNYNAMSGRHQRTFGYTNGEIMLSRNSPDCDWNHFGITEKEYDWLFNWHVQLFCNDGRDAVKAFRRDLDETTREQALSRLRKFIYYKLHKHEMCYDEKYGVRQEARTKEGNHGFARRAVKEAEAAMASVS